MQPKYYIVGGYVRDQLLGVKSKDVDFCCECNSYEDMKLDLLAKGIEIFLESQKFLTIRARHPVYGGVDYVCCRSESNYEDGRRPNEVKVGSLLSDLSRRDATCNAIAMTEEGEYIDPFGGIEDIKNKIYRCVGNSQDRFSEDSLRLLRAARFFITKNFDLHDDIVDCFNNQKIINLLENVSIERVREELFKMFTFDTLKSLLFFEKFPLLKERVFRDGLGLEPTLKKYK